MSAAPLRFLASAPRGLTDLLVHELVACGACEPRERATGVAFTGTLDSAYRACLWSRLANRVFLEIAHFEAPDVAEFASRLVVVKDGNILSDEKHTRKAAVQHSPASVHA